MRALWILVLVLPVCISQSSGPTDEPTWCESCEDSSGGERCLDMLRTLCQPGMQHCDVCFCDVCFTAAEECQQAAWEYVTPLCGDSTGSQDSSAQSSEGACACDNLVECQETNNGGYTCDPCPSGYTGDSDLGASADGCQDIDECAVDNGGCDMLAGCLNEPGSFRCGNCPEGYRGDGYSGCVIRAQVTLTGGVLRTYLGTYSDAVYRFGDVSDISVRNLNGRQEIHTARLDAIDLTVATNAEAMNTHVNTITSTLEDIDGRVQLLEAQMAHHGLAHTAGTGLGDLFSDLHSAYSVEIPELQADSQTALAQLEQARGCAALGQVWDRAGGCIPTLVHVFDQSGECVAENAGVLSWNEAEQRVMLCNGEMFLPVSSKFEYGATAETASDSCWDIVHRGGAFDDDTSVRWVTYGLNEPFKVTCDSGGYVHLSPFPSAYGYNGWVTSYSSTNSMWKCQCNRFRDEFQGRGGEWRWGAASPSYGSRQCQTYHTWQYWSVDRDTPLTYDQVNAIAAHARAGTHNLEIHTLSCDDDNFGYPDGLWIAFEASPGSNDFREQDCRSGQGGGTMRCPMCPTSAGGGCCERAVGHVFESFPFPHRVCGSINMGGGTAMIFSTTDFRVRNPDTNP